MTNRNIGYKPREGRPMSELEEEMQIEFVDKDVEPYSNNIGECVRVQLGSGAAHGVYRGLNERGSIVLIPSVISEFYPTDTNSDQGKTTYYWEEKRPNFISASAISGMSPVRKEYLDWIVENWGRSPPKFAETSPPLEPKASK